MPKDSDGEHYPLWEDIEGNLFYYVEKHGLKILSGVILASLALWCFGKGGK